MRHLRHLRHERHERHGRHTCAREAEAGACVFATTALAKLAAHSGFQATASIGNRGAGREETCMALA